MAVIWTLKFYSSIENSGAIDAARPADSTFLRRAGPGDMLKVT